MSFIIIVAVSGVGLVVALVWAAVFFACRAARNAEAEAQAAARRAAVKKHEHKLKAKEAKEAKYAANGSAENVNGSASEKTDAAHIEASPFSCSAASSTGVNTPSGVWTPSGAMSPARTQAKTKAAVAAALLFHGKPTHSRSRSQSKPFVPPMLHTAGVKDTPKLVKSQKKKASCSIPMDATAIDIPADAPSNCVADFPIGEATAVRIPRGGVNADADCLSRLSYTDSEEVENENAGGFSEAEDGCIDAVQVEGRVGSRRVLRRRTLSASFLPSLAPASVFTAPACAAVEA